MSRPAASSIYSIAVCIKDTARKRSRGTKNGHFTLIGVRREKTKGITQFADGGANDADVATVFDVGHQFESIENDFFDEVFVVSATFEGD